MTSQNEFNKAFSRGLASYEGSPSDAYSEMKKIIGESDSKDHSLDIHEYTDPFTIMAFYNSNKKSRPIIAKKLIEWLKLGCDAPNEDSSIPLLDSNKICFVNNRAYSNSEYKSKVDTLWRAFRTFVSFADKEIDEQTFIEKFDECSEINGLKKDPHTKLTMGLYWIDYSSYISLDKPIQDYLVKKYSFDTVEFKKTNGESYLKLINRVQEIIKKYNLKSFDDLSKIAYQDTNSKKTNATTESSVNYWFFVTNPRIWSFSKIGVGEVIDFEYYNEEHKKCQVFKNFGIAKKGDLAIGYESVTKKIVALGVVSENDMDKCVYFKKTEVIEKSPTFDDLKNMPELSDMEFTKINRVSLSRLTKQEYDFIIKTLEKYNGNSMNGNGDTGVNRLSQYNLNTIFYGPPGTGKTYGTVRAAVEIIDGKVSDDFKEAKERYDQLYNDGYIKSVTFHQSYGYEEFVEGIKPKISNDAKDNGAIRYTIEDGSFKSFCLLAKSRDLTKNHVFIIDEINRGNISRVFGELITLIECNKRDGNEEALSVELPYSHEKFSTPNNIYIIGTMNTADRSLVNIDSALRRRFDFIEMMPQPELLRDKNIEGVVLKDLLTEINRRIETLYDREHTIGHSYFMKIESIGDLERTFRMNIIPLLQEYFHDDYDKIVRVLSKKNDGKFSPFIRVVSSPFNDDQDDEAAIIYSFDDEALGNPENYIMIYRNQ